MFSTLLTVWIVHLASAATPGANTLLVSQLAASGQRRSAQAAALGVASGSVTWATCALMGVQAAFLAFPALRLSLQIAGGLYLLYLAAQLWQSGGSSAASRSRKLSPIAAFRLGAITNFTNPKAALFYGSIFSTTFPPEPTIGLQVGVVAVVLLNAVLWYGMLARVLSRESVRLAYARHARRIERLAGVVLGALGVRFLVESLLEARFTVAHRDV